MSLSGQNCVAVEAEDQDWSQAFVLYIAGKWMLVDVKWFYTECLMK